MAAAPNPAGLAYGLIAYGIWGFFPLYFRQLGHVPPMDILSNRAAWACVFVGLLLTLRGRWQQVRAVCRAPLAPWSANKHTTTAPIAGNRIVTNRSVDIGSKEPVLRLVAAYSMLAAARGR